LFLEKKYYFEKAIKYFVSQQFQRVGRWRGNKQSYILGLNLNKISYLLSAAKRPSPEALNSNSL